MLHQRANPKSPLEFDLEQQQNIMESADSEATSSSSQLTADPAGKFKLSKSAPLHHQLQSRSQTYELDPEHSVAFTGYAPSRTKLWIYYGCCVLTLGILYLFGRWFVGIYVRLVCVPKKLRFARLILARNSWDQVELIEVECREFPENVVRLFQLQMERSTSPTGPAELPALIVKQERLMRSFTYNCRCFILNPQTGTFFENSSWRNPTPRALELVVNGLSNSEHVERDAIYGRNSIQIPEKSSMKILIDELLHPFNVFQIFSIGVWMAERYYYYASCLVFISIFSLGLALRESKKNYERLRDISRFECAVRVRRNNQWLTASSETLVPGDVFEVSPFLGTFPCDSILLSGDCIVNESMLTGESVPVFKLPNANLEFEPDYDDLKPDSRNYLFGGTRVVRLRQPVNTNGIATEALALVVKTGFNSTKGGLVRSMLFPKPTKLKLHVESLKFVGVLAIIAVIGFFVSLGWFISQGKSASSIALKSLDLITIVVPPILPAAMLIGTSFALARLKLKNIFCISPPRINVSGKVNLFVFDKTGTLTEENLDILGVQAVDSSIGSFKDICSNVDQLERSSNRVSDVGMEDAMACCQSLNLVQGKLIGDPMDLQMFSFTRWTFEESGHSGFSSTIVRCPATQYSIVHCFEFVSALRRMSVIAKNFDTGTFFVFTKGAPEVMQDICVARSLPSDFSSCLDSHVHKGHRVLGIAARTFNEDMLYSNGRNPDRSSVEMGLQFLGFIVFENKLKPETLGVLHTLKKSRIRSVMCTGDNIYTAVSVARECGLIEGGKVYVPSLTKDKDFGFVSWTSMDEPEMVLDSRTLAPIGLQQKQLHTRINVEPLSGPDDILLRPTNHQRDMEANYFDGAKSNDYVLAVTGDVFSHLLEHASAETLQRVLVKAQVFARMSPDEKSSLVEQLKGIGYCTGMCGDGANDTGALSTADVGVSLSEAEASVAAPFTSRTASIECVLEIIREGRAALVTSFSCFKYIALYSMIQFFSVILMYTTCRTLGDFQFLYADLVLILPMAVVMGRTESRRTIHPKGPTASLVSKKVLIPLIGQIAIVFVFQVIIFCIPARPFDGCVVDTLESPENTALFLLTCFQFLIIAIIFSVGYPYRANILSNYPFLGLFVTLVVLTVLISCFSEAPVLQLLQLVNLGNKNIAAVFFLAGLNFAVAFLCEHWLFPKVIGAYQLAYRRLARVFKLREKKDRKMYKIVSEQMGIVD